MLRAGQVCTAFHRNLPLQSYMHRPLLTPPTDCLSIPPPALRTFLQDFLSLLPLPWYTRPDEAPLNLATRTAPFAKPTDLGPKAYIALGTVQVGWTAGWLVRQAAKPGGVHGQRVLPPPPLLLCSSRVLPLSSLLPAAGEPTPTLPNVCMCACPRLSSSLLPSPFPSTSLPGARGC